MRRKYGWLAVLLIVAGCTGHRPAALVVPTQQPVARTNSAAQTPRPSVAAQPLPSRAGRKRPAKGAARPSVPAAATSGTASNGVGRPPQFVVVSFDGAGNTELFQHWLDVAAAQPIKFSFFVSGLYLVPSGERARYHGPRHAAGQADIKFFTAAHVARLRDQLTTAYREGHEIGTHYNGHFCAGSAGSVGRWTTADWNSELDQFDSFVSAARLPFGPRDIVGGRTPCLEGRVDQLFPALRAHHFRYDASGTGSLGQWPVRRRGLWEFPLQTIPIAGTTRSALSMDYNMYVFQTKGVDGPASSVPAQTRQALQTYENAFEHVYAGNRAPLFLGNHFNNWNGGAYTAALTSFISDECSRPDVRCVSFRTLTDWLEAQPAAALVQLQQGG